MEIDGVAKTCREMGAMCYTSIKVAYDDRQNACSAHADMDILEKESRVVLH